LIDHSPRAELEQLRRDIVSEIKQLVSEALEQTGGENCKANGKA
jgi:hypothetical protein